MIVKNRLLRILILSFSCMLASFTYAAEEQTAPVSGFARSFLTEMVIPNATITILETGQKITTDDKGRFGPFNYPVGKPITLVLKKFGYKTTQSATIVVPETGLNSPYDNISFQVPSIEMFYILSAIVGASFDENSCHVAATITAYHKTMNDLPQGEVDAQSILTPSINEKAFYFGIFKSGPLKDKTNPFTRGLVKTSEDGGVGYFNLPPRKEPYTLSAVKAGRTFTEAKFTCRKGMFINLSPPRGPMASK